VTSTILDWLENIRYQLSEYRNIGVTLKVGVTIQPVVSFPVYSCNIVNVVCKEVIYLIA